MAVTVCIDVALSSRASRRPTGAACEPTGVQQGRGLNPRGAAPEWRPTADPAAQTLRTAMPIYAFECDACGHAFDRLQKIADPDPAECPSCGEPRVKRQLTAPSFRLAGGGWYETDFKKDGDKKRNLAESSAGSAKPEAAAAPAAAPAAPAPSSSSSST
jgi:putative FmdB family regulatory protein